MKYYLIVGEASGDLHASHLMRSLRKEDPEAEFRFFGGDLMTDVGGTRVRHFKELAYMGFIPVLLHLPTIFRNMRLCKSDIAQWQPDAVILVDYPGFNLSIAEHVHETREAVRTAPPTPQNDPSPNPPNDQTTNLPNDQTTHLPNDPSPARPRVYYYISPKIWAWKEYRIRNIRRDVDELFSILPFEVPFFEQKHHYPIHYVGNPTADEVRTFKAQNTETFEQFTARTTGDRRPIIALLAGSRRQEIKDNLPAMIEATRDICDYQLVLAGAPSIEDDYYERFLRGSNVHIVHNDTYALLAQSTAALVTSGTATLETALFGVPQVVCYKVALPHIARFAFNLIVKCRFISLVNLIADREVVPELMADRFSVESIRTSLRSILPGGSARNDQLEGYRKVADALGTTSAPDNAARLMVSLLNNE